MRLSDGRNFNDPFELIVADKKTSIEKFVDGLHILCLTNSFRKKLMWSHYADSHKGVCLTVKVPDHLVYPVCYTGKRIYTDTDLDEILSKGKINSKKNLRKPYTSLSDNKKIAFIKDQKWEYEHEYRIVFDNDVGLIIEGDNRYMSVKITNVYLGINFEDNSRDVKTRIIDICNREHITIKQMNKSKKEYAVNIR